MTQAVVAQPAIVADARSTRLFCALSDRPLLDAIFAIARNLGCERVCAAWPSRGGRLMLLDRLGTHAHSDLRLGMPLVRLLSMLPGGEDCLLIDTQARLAWSCTRVDAVAALQTFDEGATEPAQVALL